MRLPQILVLTLLSACARLDIRELLPAVVLSDNADTGWVSHLAIHEGVTAELPDAPSLSAGPLSWLPEPLASLGGSLPIFGAAARSPRWMEEARRAGGAPAGILRGLSLQAGCSLRGAAPWYALSEESAALAQARTGGCHAVLVIKPALGGEVAGKNTWPERVSVAAEVAVLDAVTARTRVRGYDRVDMRVWKASAPGVQEALRRAGVELGRRLRTRLHLQGLTPPSADDG